MTKERAPWIKLWGRYAESATLAGMDPAHRWVGVCLMLLVRTASDTRGEQTTWAEHPNGEPMSIEHIAGYAHVPVKLCRIALADFLRRDFIATREDGAFGLPKFWKYQETADAKRKRDGKVGGKSGGDSGQEDRGESSSPLRSEEVSTPYGVSPQRPEDAGAAAAGSNVLTHPTAEDGAGRVASQRRRAAVELWDWHEGERVRRLLAGSHKPRCATDKSLGPVLRLHAHVRKAYQCTEAEAWARIRAYRESRIAETELALRDGHPQAEKWRGYAAGEAAWSHKGFDYLEQRGPDPRAVKAAADAEYAAEVARRKTAARNGGGDG